VNETSRARDAWHALNDALEDARVALIAADGLPSIELADAIQEHATAFLRVVIHAQLDREKDAELAKCQRAGYHQPAAQHELDECPAWQAR
jgi:hypothetical protein